MKHTDEQIDKIIHEALSKEEAEFYDQLGEQSLLDMQLGVYQGKNKGLYVAMLIFGTILTVAFIYAAIEFYHAETVKEMLVYGGIAFFTTAMIMAIKIYNWMQMQTNRVLREMKRLELQISTLTNEVKNKH